MTTKKTVKGEVPEVDKTEILDSMTELYLNGVQRFADVQKKALDIAAKQNTEIIETWKKISQAIPGMSNLFMLDLAFPAFERFVETQKGIVDLGTEQSQAIVTIIKERTASASQAFEGTPELVKHTLEQSLAAQKKALDYSAAQTKAALESAKEQFGLAGTPAEAAAQSFQKGVESLVESQKELLDIAAKPFAQVN